MPEKPIGKKLKQFSLETRLKSTNQFRDRVLELFKGYVKAVVVWGSITRGDFTGKSDVDIYLIFDDTKMPLKKFDDIRERMDRDIYRIANDIDPRLHPQPIIALTEFWDGIRFAHPLFYNIVREGYAVHDTGFFIPMRKLLEWGKFPATVEAAELRMEGVPKRVSRVKNIKALMVAEDLYLAILDAAQSVLMYIGIGPPPPKVAAREIRNNFVEPGLLEEKYAKLLEDVVDFRKKVEHKEIKEISGAVVDEWIKKTDDYVARMEKLLKTLEADRKSSDIKRSYEVMIKASVAALKSLNKLPPEPEKLPEAFKKHLVDTGLVNPLYAEVFGKVVEMRKLLDEKQLEKVSDRDVRMSKEYVRRFVSDVRKIVEEKPLPKTEKRAPIKMGEARELIDTAKEVTELKESTTEPLVVHERLERIEEKIEKEQKKHRVVKKGARKTQVKAGK